MIRVALFSQDLKLQPLLAPALGKDFDVIATRDRLTLVDLVARNTVDVVLFDVDLEASTPDEYISTYSAIDQSGISALVMVDDSGRSVAIDLMQRGAHSYCRKPPAMRELKAMLRRAYEHSAMKRQLEGTRQAQEARAEAEKPVCDTLIGSSAAMRNVYGLIHRVADLNASVLVTGESGTGKELIARAIHNLGNRKNQPFVAVSCGAIPETLIESELFGHEKGAFTGSNGTRTGYLEQAGGGTLFLDEIGELSQQTQVKLLRVLQQKEFSRLGSSRTIPLKARIVFATHRDLPGMIAEGKFRLDLYYRINVMTIHAPSLAERPEDITALAGHFLNHYSEMYDKHVSGISPAAMRVLEDYEWPGNVRELENVIQRAIICAETNEIQVNELPDRLRSQEIAEDIDVVQAGTFERLIRDYKVRLAMKAIEDCQGNKTLAARSLDISRAYLHRLIRPCEVEVIHAA
jgi:DNA-binding NtrC family response regulator